jgi:CRP-like cAMP-binding protein
MSFSDEELEVLLPYLVVRKFKKREKIVNLGEVDIHVNYVQEGLVRKYIIHNGKEINTLFAQEGSIVCSTISFIKQQPSEVILEAIEPTILVSMTHENIEKVFAENQKFERLGRMILANQLIMKEATTLSQVKETVRERFLRFVELNPDLIQRIPQKMLASYLNIEPETFSRLKHLIRKR